MGIKGIFTIVNDKDYIGKDKLYHFLMCLFTSMIHPLLAFGLAMGKEYGDYKNPNNHWCWWDVAADLLGIILGEFIYFLYTIHIYHNLYLLIYE